MGIKDILNYPLLRGERAERWAGLLVQKPALVLAVAAPLVLAVSFLGPVATGIIAALAFSRLGVAANNLFDAQMASAMAKVEKKLLEKNGAPAVAEPVLRKDRSDLVRRFTAFSLSILPERYCQGFSFSAEPRADAPSAIAVSGIRDGAPLIALNINRIETQQRSAARAERVAMFMTAHEVGHFHQRRPIADRVKYHTDAFCNLLTFGGYAAMVIGVLGVGALFAAKLAFGGGPLIASLGGLAGSLLSSAVAGVLVGGGGHFLSMAAMNMYGRQEEYACDRFAIRKTRDMRAAVACMRESNPARPEALKQPLKLDLLYNLIAEHPCAHNRVREIGSYLRQITVQRSHSPQ